MTLKICLGLTFGVMLLLPAAVFDSPISNCKTWGTCRRQTEPNGCSINYD